MKYIKSILVISLFNAGFLMAQEPTIHNEQVLVVGGYEPTLKDAVKIEINPSLIDTGIIKYPVQYRISSRKLTTEFVPEKLKPARIVGEPISLLYRNYLKLGVGSHLMPYAEYYHSNTRSKNAQYGVYVNHLSSWLSIPEYDNTSYANTEVQIFGRRLLNNAVLSGDVFYKNDYYHYYGRGTVLGDSVGNPFHSDPHTIHRLGFNARYQSAYSNTEKLHHSAGLHLQNMMGMGKLNELNVKVDANLHKKLSFFYGEKQTLGLNFSWEHFADRRDSVNLPTGYRHLAGEGLRKGNASIFDVNPYVLLNIYGLHFNAGVHAFAGVEEDSTTWVLSPEVALHHTFFKDILFLKAGISGSFERAGLDKMLRENPYLSPLSASGFVKNPFNLFGRVELAMEKHLDLNAEFAYSVFKNAPLFGIDSSFRCQNVYMPIYDDYEQFKIGGELVYEIENKFRVGAAYYYYSYSTSNEAEAWYKPSFELRLNGKYRIADKFIFGLTTSFLGKMHQYTWQLNSDGTLSKELGKIENRMDINLSAEYRYSKRLSFFLLLNNIANQQYFVWTNYPTQRMNALVGLTFSF